MFKKSILSSSLALALVAPSFVMAEVEATIELKNETAIFITDDQTIGQATNMLDKGTDHSGGDVYKFENQAKIFLNGDIGEESSWHAELQIIYDAAATDSEANGGINYRGYEEYTQHDYFRELYVDTEAAGWSLRLGKQQVVWGTADGIKLLDIINPTDFREVNQNVMEDARIPVWMINAERELGDSGNFQVVISQAEKNKIPGLNPSGDSGHPFVMKGPDTIAGQVNGFFNIGNQMSLVAGSFNAAAGPSFGSPTGDLSPFGGLTVNGFAGGGGLGGGFAGLPGYAELNAITQGTNAYVTNLMPVTGTGILDTSWNPSGATSMFEYMPNATFATFNTFDGMSTQWVEDDPDEPNAGFRFKSSLDNGLNYSLNYFYHYNANPDLTMSWHDSNGDKLTVQRVSAGGGGVPDLSTDLSIADIHQITDFGAAPPVTLLLHNGDKSTYYAANQVSPFAPVAMDTNGVSLRFNETYHRVHSIGGSFDYAFETDFAPVVLRGEFLYDKDDRQTVIDKHLLSIGDFTNAFTSQDADYFKYVIGADFTVMTNLLASFQFIQFINLDYVDQDKTCTTQAGQDLGDGAGVAYNIDCSRYTADLSTMSLDNGFQKAEEYKNFISVFFSKPIGEDQLGRWNNITILEEEGGFWNRLDAEYSISDQFIVMGEWNHYWGDENTTFGQLENSSNLQVGFKYIFEDY